MADGRIVQIRPLSWLPARLSEWTPYLHGSSVVDYGARQSIIRGTMPEHFGRQSRAAFRRRLASLAVPVLLLAGCVVGPDFLRPKAPQHDGYTEGAVDLTVSGK